MKWTLFDTANPHKTFHSLNSYNIEKYQEGILQTNNRTIKENVQIKIALLSNTKILYLYIIYIYYKTMILITHIFSHKTVTK